jgi:hypothetical protein
VAEPGVQERGGDDPEEAVGVARLDPVLVEAQAAHRVDDLDDPHESRHAGHEGEPFAAPGAGAGVGRIDEGRRARGHSLKLAARRHAPACVISR